MTLLKQSFLCAGLLVVTAFGCAAQTAPKGAAPASNAAPAVAVKTNTLGEIALFDGKTLKGWAVSDFASKGPVSVTNGQIHLGSGYMTGVNWTGDIPRMNYEISLDAKRVEGSDFFCGLTFPVETNYCSFVVGGWGGGVVGLSSLDGDDASQNETTKYLTFTNGQWYHIRLRVIPGKIQAWIDNEQMVDVETEDRRLSVRLEMESSAPLGVATWNTGSALRNIKLKHLNPDDFKRRRR